MGIDAWVTLAVTVVLFVALTRNVSSPDVLFVGAIVVLAAAGVITPQEAFSGFANPAVITVGMLFIVSATLRETGVINGIAQRVLGNARTEFGILNRIAAVVLPLSAFLNNTAVVSIFLPVITEWTRRRRSSASRLLMPLSFLAILGGTCTLIGTSTNLVVHGLMIEYDLKRMKLFEIGQVGLPYAIVGYLYLTFIGRKLIPDRKELLEQLDDSSREYLVETIVQKGSNLLGKTVESAGLRQLPGLFLIEINRQGNIQAPVSPDAEIQAGDRLVFTGITSRISELESLHGLKPVINAEYSLDIDQKQSRHLCEVVISVNSHLIGKSIRQADFRAVYGAAVVAVHRGDTRIRARIGDIRLRAGDTLLLQTVPHFVRAHQNDPAFYLISYEEMPTIRKRSDSWISLTIFGGMLITMVMGWVPVVLAVSIAAVLMLATRVIAPGTAHQSIEWQVLVTIGAAFGLGVAYERSGAAVALVSLLVESTEALGPLAALAVIYLVGSIMTELITNNATAVLLFPFCIETARLYKVDVMPFFAALILAASASFMTPIGYQTNMMVYGPGGYRFTDFLRVGLPLNLILWLLAIVLIPLIWPF
ncbi:MAG: SLC13 family permease [Leptospiraceae bacterium]|nr:SLC13 family permease [Leptospiraceae bacterium]